MITLNPLRSDWRAAFVLVGVASAALSALFVPTCSAEPMRKIPVPSVTIYPGDSIADAAIVERAFSAGNAWLGGMIADRDQLIGKIARRTLPAGGPIPVDAVRSSYRVTRGQTVTLILRHGALSISGRGLALQSAGDGERISVRNSDSGRTIFGVVQPDQTVEVDNR